MKLEGIYDNRATMRREGWFEGHLQWSTSAQLVESKPPGYVERLRRMGLYVYRPFGHYPDVPRELASPSRQ